MLRNYIKEFENDGYSKRLEKLSATAKKKGPELSKEGRMLNSMLLRIIDIHLRSLPAMIGKLKKLLSDDTLTKIEINKLNNSIEKEIKKHISELKSFKKTIK